jgi:OmcA/MtrC family decaheme c-type cytochrome
MSRRRRGAVPPLVELDAFMVRPAFALVVLCALACGSTGTPGPPGAVGPPGAGCPALAPGETPGVRASISVSSPSNGQFFVTGEQPVLTIYFANSYCGQLIQPAQLTAAELMVYGPRDPLQTVTNMDLLLNSPVVTFNAYANLQGYADGGPPNLRVNQDGVISYTLNAISNLSGSTHNQSGGATYTQEVAGTYSAAVLALGASQLDQDFELVDFQIGTATVEAYAAGPADGGQVSATDHNSSCFACHQNFAPGGKTYMAHIVPELPRAPDGDYARDSLPIASCKACHNNASYSPNTLMRKAHAVHRGEHQLAPGVAHLEYGEGPDPSLVAYLNVGFPMMPGGGTPFQAQAQAQAQALTADVAMEKNCVACHVNDVWETQLSRAACGTCHDNVFFAGAPLPDGGVDPKGQNVVPPTLFGQPSTGPCASDHDCTGFPAGGNPSYSAATCDLSNSSPTYGSCILKTHPIPASANPDVECSSCHAASTSTIPGFIAPVDTVHNINQWSPPITLDGYSFQNVSVTGGTGPGGSFNVGDIPALSFELLDNTGASVPDLQTNSAWSGTFIVAGPTSNPQRIYGSPTGGVSMKSATLGTLTYDAGTYTYTPNGGWPANALSPILSGLTPQPAQPGSYTVWFYWARTTSGVRDAVDAQAVVSFEATGPVQARQVVTMAACAACHGASADGFPHLALHGDQRKNGETCSTCHSQYAEDFGVGSTGLACTSNAQCGGYDSANPADSWEQCLPNSAVTDGGSICTVTVDPTPGVEIDFQKLAHNIHFARLRAGYAEQNNLGQPWATPIPILPGTLNYLGFQNTLNNFQQVLSPVDVRACTNCHQDSQVSCSTTTPCAYGQTCGYAGTCVNVAWKAPSTRACMTCHDSADDALHAQLNTYTPPSGAPIETCNVCHGSDASFSVQTMHNITTLYSLDLAYPREP